MERLARKRHCSDGKQGGGRRAFIEGLLTTARKKIRVAMYMTKYGDGVGLF